MSLPPLPYAAAPRANNLPPPGERAPRGPNKITQTLRRAIMMAADEAGDVIADLAAAKGETRTRGLEGYLLFVATSEPKAFCALLGRILPLEVTGGGGGPIEVTFKTVYEDAAPGDSATIING